MKAARAISVLVVDDETPARERLLDLLRNNSGIATVTEAANGNVAVALIQKLRPDLVFLDVQMPELDGIGVIDRIGTNNMPFTVFVTAYDTHAIRAFEANALDYLLKPFSDERFEETMARVKYRIKERNIHPTQGGPIKIGGTTTPQPPIDLLIVKSTGVTRLLRASEIDWVEAAGVYVTLHIAGKEVLHRASLNDLAERLAPASFVRIHRSTIVNIQSVSHLEPASHGEFDAVLKSGVILRVSRTYRQQLDRCLGQSL